MMEESQAHAFDTEVLDTLMEKLRMENRIEVLERLDTSRVLVQLGSSVLLFEDRAGILRTERTRRVQVERKLLYTERRGQGLD